MIYILRLIVGTPAIAAGGASMFFLLLALDKPVLLLLAMPLFAAFVILLIRIDSMAEGLREWLRTKI